MIDLRQAVERAVGIAPVTISPLSGGCIGQVYLVTLARQDKVVVKIDESPTPRLNTEGLMLQYLAQNSTLPVPAVIHNAPDLLIMEYLPGESRFSAEAETHAAELLAALHAISTPNFGFAQATLIGGLSQPNDWSDSWLTFFSEHRLLYMAREALDAGRLPPSFIDRLEALCRRLADWLSLPDHPSLLHGDVWTTNVLAMADRITGFVDPAIYYGHPEIELAFTTLFGTFGDPFFKRYQELRPLPHGFFETRRDIYNLYPLLVHVRLFGGGYVRSVDTILSRFGF